MPFGERVEGQGRDAQRVIDPSTHRAVEQVVRMRQQGETLQAIADALNEQGSTGRHGGKWWPMGVRRILEREERYE